VEYQRLEEEQFAMTTTNPEPTQPQDHPPHGFVQNITIGSKLTMGFGIMIVLTLFVAGASFLAGVGAINTINRTGDLRVPVALASSRAQADLLRMFGDVRGYLALGDPQFLTSYEAAERSFRQDLDHLDELAVDFDPSNKNRLDALKQAFEQWAVLPATLFALRNDQMEREPAYNWLNTQGVTLGGNVLININQMIEAQAKRTPSNINNELLRDMAKFQSSFAAMISGLRGYVTTRNTNFRSYEYDVNLALNNRDWESLIAKKNQLTSEQQTMLEKIGNERQSFIEQVPTEIFSILETDNYEWRKDLYLFATEVEPLTEKMQQLLLEMTENQQLALQTDLNQGRQGLDRARWQTIISGGVALVLGIWLAFFLQRIIAGPIRRLTAVANNIRGGELSAVAKIESGDEIGVFAETFNSMTAKLRDTLTQISKEKKRADDLLNVVIPIGVALSSERDFNRLMENMLVEAMSYCNADSGTLFLREQDNLRPVMIRITSKGINLGGTSKNTITTSHLELKDEPQEATDRIAMAAYAVHTGATVNVENIQVSQQYNFARILEYDQEIGYQTISVLAIPLKNNKQEVVGILQLANAQDTETQQVIPFDSNLQQMMQSFSSLAVAAFESYIREQKLRQEIQQLRIEIDESKKQKEVSDIVDTDFFQDLRAKARSLRQRNKGMAGESTDAVPTTENQE
jgi:CHASE3 domain sensor protein/GAF domain-containing protein